jgi:hypothetical protein
MVLSENILGAYSLVHHGSDVFLDKNHQTKTLSYEGNILCKFLILKNNSSINGHKLVV